MGEYICPDKIVAMFDDEATKPVGRQRTIDWIKTLSLQEGDKVWLPEVGWHERGATQH